MTTNDTPEADVTVEQTTNVRVFGLGQVKIKVVDGATVESVLQAALVKLNADPEAVEKLFPVRNGVDVTDPAGTPVQGGDRITAMPATDNG